MQTLREGGKLRTFGEFLRALIFLSLNPSLYEKLNDKDNVSYKQFGNAVNVQVVKMFADFLLHNQKFSHTDYNLTIKEDSSEQISLFT